MPWVTRLLILYKLLVTPFSSLANYAKLITIKWRRLDFEGSRIRWKNFTDWGIKLIKLIVDGLHWILLSS